VSNFGRCRSSVTRTIRLGDRGKITTWLRKSRETVYSGGLVSADKKSWIEVKCVADDPKGG
jgi:hypothetical protein